MAKKTAAQLERDIARFLARPAADVSRRAATARGRVAVAPGGHKLHTAARSLLRDRPRRSHQTAPAKKPGRWSHKAMASAYNVAEDVVRRIYGAVQLAKRQGLHGGYLVDLIERSVGRKLINGEYNIVARAKEHLGYAPAGGYGGPKPSGVAREPARPRYDDPKIRAAQPIRDEAESTIRSVLRRHQTAGCLGGKEKVLLAQAADELDVAADLYEEAGAKVLAGTLHERARHARSGYYRKLLTYD